MAGASLLTLLDDIAAILDDVALMTKVAAKKSAAIADDVTTMTKVATQKTAGVLGDDLALNAQQVADVRADRELPVVWAVAKGSLINKCILVPAALLISALLPSLITPLLMLGGAFLCFEGAEKLLHKLLHSKADDEAAHVQHARANASQSVDLVAMEKDKIKGAVRTDFILSAEIIVIALGTVACGQLRATGGRSGRHCRSHDGGGLRPGGRHRQDRRFGPLVGSQTPGCGTSARAFLAGVGSLADEISGHRRHRSHVSGGGRNPGARHQVFAPCRGRRGTSRCSGQHGVAVAGSRKQWAQRSVSVHSVVQSRR
jgi:hypothetical protein